MKTHLSQQEAEHRIGRCFATGPPGRVGVELEWLVRREGDRYALIDWAPTGPVPGGGRLTREPGGQIELSSLPEAGLAACVAASAAGQEAIETALAEHGLVLDGSALDPWREPRRIVEEPRYAAMEAFFDGDRAGKTMMCSTASVQINLDVGTESGPLGYRRRWFLAHRLGPVLVASFANSPLAGGRPTGWKSTRQALWARIDPGRTRPVPDLGDPARDWTGYALDARLMCLRRGPGEDWGPPAGLTFRSWLGGGAERPPTAGDLDYHLGTLFPPVRPRGWLELRMVDAQPGRGWIVPLAVCTALMDDPVAAGAAWEATEGLCEGAPVPPWTVWLRAAESGLADPGLREAAEACMAIAGAALEPGPIREAVADFAARYTRRGRCPADDRLDRSPALPAQAAEQEIRS